MITYRGVKCYSFLLIPYVSLITPFGVLFKCKSDEILKRYLSTHDGKVCFNHERIHLLQVEELGWFLFLVYYIYFYFKLRFKGYSHKDAYHNIPFEREARENKRDYNYDTTYWEDYIII